MQISLDMELFKKELLNVSKNYSINEFEKIVEFITSKNYKTYDEELNIYFLSTSSKEELEFAFNSFTEQTKKMFEEKSLEFNYAPEQILLQFVYQLLRHADKNIKKNIVENYFYRF